jgi:hypothetical protein
VLEPSTKGYYRLKWTEPDGTPGDTSAGKILEHALEKPTEINDRVTSATCPKAVTALDVVVAAYLAAGHSPYKDKKPWKPAEQEADRGQPDAPQLRTPARHGRDP